jgi:hypothetical protein
MAAVKSARLNIGVTEVGGENRGKAVESYLASCIPVIPSGSPWCVAVVRFRLKQAATEVVLLHEGAKVFVLDSLDNWKKVQLTDGTEGWINQEFIRQVY